jgi:zinc protease
MQIPIEQYTLDNGLRVVLSRDDALPIVAVNLWYNVGSRDEQPGRTGLAHLFEHMMFQGSLNVTDTQHIQWVERVGGTINASTWLDRTNYYTILPSSHLELALWLDADRMGGFVAALTQEKFDNQREVVKNERRQRVDNAPYGDWDERLQRLVWPEDHPYHHSVIGSMEDLDAASLEDVANFFRTYYAPNNAVLTLCGDFDPAEAREMVDRHFGPVPRGPEVPAIPGRTLVDPIQTGTLVRERVESAVALARVYVAHRIPPYGTTEYYVADLLSELLAGGKSARMYRSLVREQRMTASVGAFPFPAVKGASAFVLRGNALPGQSPEPLEAAIIAELQAVADAPPTDAEMERAMTGLEARRILELQKIGERADNIGMLATYFGDPELINTELERYRVLTARDVQAFVRNYLTEDNRVVLTYVPQAAAEAA